MPHPYKLNVVAGDVRDLQALLVQHVTLDELPLDGTVHAKLNVVLDEPDWPRNKQPLTPEAGNMLHEKVLKFVLQPTITP